MFSLHHLVPNTDSSMVVSTFYVKFYKKSSCFPGVFGFTGLGCFEVCTEVEPHGLVEVTALLELKWRIILVDIRVSRTPTGLSRTNCASV